MLGIELDKPIAYKSASLRFFKEGEHHVSRLCKDDVLLLVYDGVLRFSEDGRQCELHPGQYYIQRHDILQTGERPSDSPRYLYVHFLADWGTSGTVLPRSGVFEYAALRAAIENLNTLAHTGAPYVAQAGRFYDLLAKLYQVKPADSTADKIADYIARQCPRKINLDMLCEEFHFSKNHMIHLMKSRFDMTPIAYANYLRLQQAEYLIEVTSESLESIASQCGFQNYSHFYKLFFQRHKLSPEQWRKQRRIG